MATNITVGDAVLVEDSNEFNKPKNSLKKTIKPGKRNKYARKAVNISLFTSFALTAVGLIGGFKKMHVFGGCAFMGLSAMHGYKHRKGLLPKQKNLASSL